MLLSTNMSEPEHLPDVNGFIPDYLLSSLYDQAKNNPGDEEIAADTLSRVFCRVFGADSKGKTVSWKDVLNRNFLEFEHCSSAVKDTNLRDLIFKSALDKDFNQLFSETGQSVTRRSNCCGLPSVTNTDRWSTQIRTKH